MQFVDPAHPREVGRRHRFRLVIDRRARDPQQPCLGGKRQCVASVNHRFALSNPALLSAPDKKSFCNVNSPISACSSFKSTPASAVSRPPPKTDVAPSSNCVFHAVIWFGWTSNCLASSASVLSPLIAAIATLTLNAGECVRRVRLVIFLAPLSSHQAAMAQENALIALSNFVRPPLSE